MEPTLHNGEIVFSNTNLKPNINDVVVFKYDNNQYIKRIKAIYPENNFLYSIETTQDVITYYLIPNNSIKSNDSKMYKLKKDEVWVEGDNKNNSEDSRTYGPIKRSDIVGVIIGLN